jgi:SAM-dependent methyltransferase
MSGDIACPYCSDPSPPAIDTIQSPYHDAAYLLFSCRKCGSQFFNLEEGQVDLEALYEEQASEGGYKAEEVFTPSPYWRRQVRVLQRLHGNPKSVLDIGCRTGDFLLHWRPDIERVGIELSARAAGIAAARGLEIVQCPVEQYSPGRAFDIVTAYAVLEHLSKPKAFLCGLASLVAPGGVAAIMIPSHESAKARRLGSQWGMYTPPLHLSFASGEALDRLMAESRFSLVDRRFGSGGLFNPFKRIPVARGLWSRGMVWADMHGPLSRRPTFDHMYSYYKRKG